MEFEKNGKFKFLKIYQRKYNVNPLFHQYRKLQFQYLHNIHWNLKVLYRLTVQVNKTLKGFILWNYSFEGNYKNFLIW